MRTSLTQRGGLSGGPSPTWHAPKRRSVTHLREGLYDHARGETARFPDQHLTQMDDGSPTATVPPWTPEEAWNVDVSRFSGHRAAAVCVGGA